MIITVVTIITIKLLLKNHDSINDDKGNNIRNNNDHIDYNYSNKSIDKFKKKCNLKFTANDIP
jgi:hypothetical protein